MDNKMPAIIARIIPIALGNDNFSFSIKILNKTVTTGYKVVNETIIKAGRKIAIPIKDKVMPTANASILVAIESNIIFIDLKSSDS